MLLTMTDAADSVSIASASDRAVDEAPPAASAQTPVQCNRNNNQALLAELQWQVHLPIRSLLVLLLDLHAGQPLWLKLGASVPVQTAATATQQPRQ